MSGPGCPWDPSPRAQVAGKLSLVWEGEGSPQRREPLPEWRALRGGRVPLESRAGCPGKRSLHGEILPILPPGTLASQASPDPARAERGRSLICPAASP